MNNAIKGRYYQFFFCVFICVLFSCFTAKATTTDDLIADNQLTVTAKVIPKEQQIVGQPIIISVEVATSRWFARGTRIDKLNLKDVIILPSNELSINGTKKVAGVTWTTQTREITLYPTRKGRYELAKISVSVSVNTEKNGVVEGVVNTSALTFNISLPDELVKIDKFIVSPAVTVNVEGDISPGQEYAVGEAFTQTITITAKNTPAMMIPPLLFPSIEGISIYQKPSQVLEHSNRGSLTGSRIETVTYIFEQAGDYHIDAQQLYWWNTTNNELEEVIIEAKQWTVAGNKSSQGRSTRNHFIITKEQLFYLCSLVLLLIVSFQLFKYKKIIAASYIKYTHLEQRKLKKEFLTAVQQQNDILAVNLLFKFFHQKNKGLNNLRLMFTGHPTHLLLLDKLYQCTFHSNNIKQTSISLDEAKTLINFIPMKHQTKNQLGNKITLNNE